MERSRVCRICMTESGVVLSLFGEDAFWRKIVSFANVEIHENDSLPQQICMMCARGVINASSLKQKCEDADKYFRRIAEASSLSTTITTQIVVEQREIEVKNEPVDTFESTSSIVTSQDHTPMNSPGSHKPSLGSVNCRGFTSPESSIERQPTAPSPNQTRDHRTPSTSTMISIPIRCKVNDKPEAIVTPNQKVTEETTSVSQQEKLAPIKLRYSSSTSSAQILSSPTNATSSANLTNLPGETTPARKKRCSATKTSKSTGVLKAKKRIKKNALSKRLSPKNATITANALNGTTSSLNANPTTNKVLPKQCGYCGEKFALKVILKHHMKVSHPDIQTKVQCQKCNKFYSSNLAYEKHLRNGQCEKNDQIQEATPAKGNFTCDRCHQTFPTGRHFGWHKRLSHCYKGKQGRVKKKPTVLAVRPLSTLVTPANDMRTSLRNQESIEEEQDKEVKGKASRKNSQNRSDIVETTFRWSTSEFNGGELQRKNNPNDQTELDENINNTNTNQTLNPSNRKQSRPGRPKKLNSSLKLRKARKPYVFMDHIKFQQAKKILANGGIAADVAKELNISPITAWRVSQCIANNTPLKFRKRRKGLVNVNSGEDGLNLSAEGDNLVSSFSEQLDMVERAQSGEDMKTNAETQNKLPLLCTSTPIIPQRINKKPVNLLNTYVSSDTDKNPQICGEKQLGSRQSCESLTKPLEAMNNSTESTNTQSNLISDQGVAESRLKSTVRGTKRAERKQAIMKEILTILKEDRYAQYWKISNRLAEKGYHVTPPTICRKLKSIGINRRSHIIVPSKNVPLVQDT